MVMMKVFQFSLPYISCIVHFNVIIDGIFSIIAGTTIIAEN